MVSAAILDELFRCLLNSLSLQSVDIVWILLVIVMLQNSDQCDSCRHAKDGPYCVAECPGLKYPDSNNSCQPCHVNCKNGCSGPANTIGANACKSCDLIRFDEDNNIQHCMTPEDDCGDGYYKGFLPSNRKIKVNGKMVDEWDDYNLIASLVFTIYVAFVGGCFKRISHIVKVNFEILL